MNRSRSIVILLYLNSAALLTAACWLFLLPGMMLLRDLRDQNLRRPGVPDCAARWHRVLTPRYERWARARVTSGTAESLSVHDIAGTEWPLFGSVFYLWATESLQDAWDASPHAGDPPRVYARRAIDAAAALLADPGHAAWVRKHWGDDYLQRENVFYRMLLIAGFTSHRRLTDDDRYMPLLRSQVETLSRQLDESPHGLLDDYPGECYPTDVLAAVAAVRRADAVLSTDHSAFLAQLAAAFAAPFLDTTGLPPYAANAGSGTLIGPSRGCGDSFMLTWLPELWPDLASDWYDRYEKSFWQVRWTAAGFREFPKDPMAAKWETEWYADVDAGPVLAGHGIAACAFGVGASRANGQFDHALPLAAEMLVTCWPLPDGTLLGPRLLSNAVDAPYLGEAGVIFALTRQPPPEIACTAAGPLPRFCIIVLASYFAAGLILLAWAAKHVHNSRHPLRIRAPRFQLMLWATLMIAAILCVGSGHVAVGMALVLTALLLPRGVKQVDISPPQS